MLKTDGRPDGRRDGRDKNNKAFLATVRTRLKKDDAIQDTCYSLNRIFTGVQYDEVRLNKARVVT
jgi:hypothetical protein